MISTRLKNPAALRAGIRTLANIRSTTVRKELQRNAGIIAEYCAKMTPPTTGRGQNKNAINQSWAVQQRAGKKAIRRDIAQCFQPLRSIAFLKNVQWAAVVNKMIRKRDIKGIEHFLASKGLNSRVIIEATTEIHDQARNRRGRVRKKMQPYLVINGASIRKLRELRESHIGQAKAGWSPAMSQFSRPLPPDWVTRHRTPSQIRDRSWNALRPSVTVKNQVRYGSSFNELQIARTALDIRSRTAAKEIRETLRGNLKRAMRTTGLGK
jgi:hypothetical protein